MQKLYTCSCQGNYKQEGDYNCKWITESGLKQCECSKAQDAYCDWSNDENCQCKHGLEFNSTSKSCHAIENINDKTLCPNGKTVIKNNRVVCDCPPQFQLIQDDQTKYGLCKLKDLCGQAGGNVCKKRNALCYVDLTKDEGYRCECPVGLLHKNSSDPTSECVPACDLYDRKIMCRNHLAACNQIKAYGLNDKHENVNVKELCDCPAGKTWNTVDGKDKCVYLAYTVKFELEFEIRPFIQETKSTAFRIFKVQKMQKFNKRSRRAVKAIDSNAKYDIEGYQSAISNQDKFNEEQLKSVNKEYQEEQAKKNIKNKMRYILRSLYSQDKGLLEEDSIHISSCSPGSNGKTKCEFVVKLEGPLDEYNLVEETFKNFKKLCYSTQSNDCLFALPQDKILIPNSALDLKTFNKLHEVINMNNTLFINKLLVF